MSDKKTIHLMIDTSVLRGDGFDDPDFRKLLQLSKDGSLRIYIPYIVWEERRTQLIDKLYNGARKLSESFETLKSQFSGSIFVQDLSPPALSIWSKAEIVAKSKKVMADFAAENKIEIVPLAKDHAERSWQRYFDVDLPFNPEMEKRVDRRKDIPDAWIFETVIDLHQKYPELFSLCRDGGLSTAIRTLGINVFKESRQVMDEIEKILDTKPEAKAVISDKAMPMMVTTENELDVVLTHARDTFKDLDTKVLGYVNYLGPVSKEQLFKLLSRSGMDEEIAKNIADRLVITGIITDTGNHYLPVNQQVSELASTLVETEIIRLLSEG